MKRYIVSNIALAAFLGLFVYINIQAVFRTADISYAFIAMNEAVFAVLFLLRKPAVSSSTSFLDWGVAFSATFLGTLLRPAGALSAPFGRVLIDFGLIITIAGALSLGRSISIVPAERTIKTAGLYRYVRHPMYISELISMIGYVLVNYSLGNVVIALCTTGLMIERIRREELFLSRNALYRSYVMNVYWKLIPFVY